jgi:hypothetical protein
VFSVLSPIRSGLPGSFSVDMLFASLVRNGNGDSTSRSNGSLIFGDTKVSIGTLVQ